MPADAVVAGSTMGGARVYRRPAGLSAAPNVIWVVDSTHRTWFYGWGGNL